MKILRLIPSMNPRAGGPVEGIHQWTPLLQNLGHRTEVATLDCPQDSWGSSFSSPIHRLGTGKSHYGYSSRWVPWLKENLKRFDVVVIHGLWQYHAFGSWRVLRKKNIPYVVYCHGMLDPWFKVTYPLKHLKKWLYWPWAEYRVLRDAKAVMFTTEQERLLARQSFWLYQVHETVLPYGIRDPHPDFSKHENREAGSNDGASMDFNILFLARLHPKKNLEILLKAFAVVHRRNSNLKLKIGGASSDVGYGLSLRKLAHEDLSIPEEKIDWIGFIEGEAKKDLLESADLFVLPSSQENFGFSVVEALAYGLPVIISKEINIAEQIQKEEVGGVFDGSLDDLISKMNLWISKIETERDVIRQRSRALFCERYDLEKGVAIWEREIQSICEKKK